MIAYLRANMIDIDYDTISFKIIVRGDGTGLVVAYHNAILGDRWLGVLPKREVEWLLRGNVSTTRVSRPAGWR